MKISLAFALALLAGPVASAASFEMIGEGSASAKAEFLKIGIAVASECHTSSKEARQKADAAVQGVIDVLKARINPNIDRQLQIYPGANTRASKTRYEHGKGEIVVCDLAHGWSSRSSLYFKLTEIDSLPDIQDAILGLNPEQAELRMNEPMLSVSMDSPQPSVFEETYNRLGDEALKKAYEAALRQVKVLLELTPGVTASLVRVSATHEVSGRVAYDRLEAGSAPPTSTYLGQVTVSVSRKFTFKTNQP